jgi:hypothetical protein
MMVRVLAPAGATAEEVANQLYGTTELAHLVVGHGERFAFAFPPGKSLAEPFDSEWSQHIAEEGEPLATDIGLRNYATDPADRMDDETAEARALDSTGGRVPTTHGQEPVIQRLGIGIDLLQSMADDGAQMGVGAMIGPALARLQSRLDACLADPAEAERWSAHSEAQLDVLVAANAGLSTIKTELLGAGAPGRSTADGDELAADVSASMQLPTKDVVRAFAQVVLASDQLDVARERLAIAQERLAAYPFDKATRALAVIDRRLGALPHGSLTHSIDHARIAALHADITATVGRLRIAMMSGDANATFELQALESDIAMLDLQSSIGAVLGGVNKLESQLFASDSLHPDWRRRDEIRERLVASMVPWREVAEQYDAAWQAGHERDPEWLAWIRSRVGELRQNTELPSLIQEVASYAEDEASKQRWIEIGLMIGFALVAAVSGGVASAAIGGVAGAIVGTGLEAITFTALSQTLADDPTFGGFMAELAVNAVTFGGLRAIGASAKALAAGRALTLTEKVTEMSVEGLWMVATAKAHEKIQEIIASGGQVNHQSAAAIFGETMLISFASRVVARVGGAFIEGVKGAENVPEVRAALALRGEALDLGNRALAGDKSVAAELGKTENASMRADAKGYSRLEELAANPAEARALGVEIDAAAATQIKELAQATNNVVLEREIAELTQQAQKLGDNLVAEPEVYRGLVEKHRAAGAEVTEGTDRAGNLKARVRPKLADGTIAPPVTIHLRLGDDLATVLASKGIKQHPVFGDYMMKRRDDPNAALQDLRNVRTPEDLDKLLIRTLGDEAAIDVMRDYGVADYSEAVALADHVGKDSTADVLVGENQIRAHYGNQMMASEFMVTRNQGDLVAVEVKNQRQPDAGHAIQKFEQMSEAQAARNSLGDVPQQRFGRFELYVPENFEGFADNTIAVDAEGMLSRNGERVYIDTTIGKEATGAKKAGWVEIHVIKRDFLPKGEAIMGRGGL